VCDLAVNDDDASRTSHTCPPAAITLDFTENVSHSVRERHLFDR
jgi:hypothetical protein